MMEPTSATALRLIQLVPSGQQHLPTNQPVIACHKQANFIMQNPSQQSVMEMSAPPSEDEATQPVGDAGVVPDLTSVSWRLCGAPQQYPAPPAYQSQGEVARGQLHSSESGTFEVPTFDPDTAPGMPKIASNNKKALDSVWPKELLDMTVPDLNRYIKSRRLRAEDVRRLKEARRRMKNRGYAKKSRSKRMNQTATDQACRQVVMQVQQAAGGRRTRELSEMERQIKKMRERTQLLEDTLKQNGITIPQES